MELGMLLPAEIHASATVLVAEVVGVHDCTGSRPDEHLKELHRLYSAFDAVVQRHGVLKVRGSSCGEYICASNISAELNPVAHVDNLVACASALIEECRHHVLGATGEPVQLVIGIHSGELASGIIGQIGVSFDLFGVTMQIAKAVQLSGVANRVQLSADAFRWLSRKEGFANRGPLQLPPPNQRLSMWLQCPDEASKRSVPPLPCPPPPRRAPLAAITPQDMYSSSSTAGAGAVSPPRGAYGPAAARADGAPLLPAHRVTAAALPTGTWPGPWECHSWDLRFMNRAQEAAFASWRHGGGCHRLDVLRTLIALLVACLGWASCARVHAAAAASFAVLAVHCVCTLAALVCARAWYARRRRAFAAIFALGLTYTCGVVASLPFHLELPGDAGLRNCARLPALTLGLVGQIDFHTAMRLVALHAAAEAASMARLAALGALQFTADDLALLLFASVELPLVTSYIHDAILRRAFLARHWSGR